MNVPTYERHVDALSQLVLERLQAVTGAHQVMCVAKIDGYLMALSVAEPALGGHSTLRLEAERRGRQLRDLAERT